MPPKTINALPHHGNCEVTKINTKTKAKGIVKISES